MIVTSKLNQEHIIEKNIVTESMSYAQEHGYNFDILEEYNVINKKRDDENTGYTVLKVETTEVPFDQADIVEDKYEMYICNCPSYRYGKGIPDLEEHDITAWEPCKHMKSINKFLKAKTDQQQAQL